jgi:hypothetical protein
MASAFRINLLPNVKIDRDTGAGSTGLGRSLRIPAAISWRVLNKKLMPAGAMSFFRARGKRATPYDDSAKTLCRHSGTPRKRRARNPKTWNFSEFWIPGSRLPSARPGITARFFQQPC